MQKTKKNRDRQLRNGDSELQALTQWVGRKCRNHNPAQSMERGGSRSSSQVGIVADDDKNTVIYQSGGRRFKIEVTEILDESEGFILEPVGY